MQTYCKLSATPVTRTPALSEKLSKIPARLFCGCTNRYRVDSPRGGVQRDGSGATRLRLPVSTVLGNRNVPRGPPHLAGTACNNATQRWDRTGGAHAG